MFERIRRAASQFVAEEPARLAERVRLALAGAVGTSWLTVPDEAVNIGATAAALGASWLLSRWTRKKVTPVAKLTGCADGLDNLCSPCDGTCSQCPFKS